MAHIKHSALAFQNRVNTPAPIHLLQVFNGGKPCGWLGQTPAGFWFHYSSNSSQQNWVSLLMPPSTNFYQQEELFPVFAQHANRLIQLHQGQQDGRVQLGALSFANPDNPVVTPPLRTPPPLSPGQSALIVNPRSSQVRRPFPDTMVHHRSCWSLIQTLQDLKKRVDPNNRLQALRWAQQAQQVGEWIQHPRPDMASYHPHLHGFEAAQAVLNLGQQQFETLTKTTNKFVQVLQELARTYCKNSSAEIALLELLLPQILQQQLSVYLVYDQASEFADKNRPNILGLEYLPNADYFRKTPTVPPSK